MGQGVRRKRKGLFQSSVRGATETLERRLLFACLFVGGDGEGCVVGRGDDGRVSWNGDPDTPA